MDYQTIQVEVADGVGLLRMNRPRHLNALNKLMMTELSTALAALNGDPAVAAVVLAAEGRSFCAGLDLKESAERNTTTTAAWRKVIEDDFDFIMQFWDSPKPTIAAVQGHCVAAGMELATACDLTVADASAVFGAPEVKFGSSIVSLTLPWLIGAKLAKEILLTGNDQITADRAAAMGLVNTVVDAGKHVERALELAGAIASSSALSVQLTKRAINRSLDIRGMRQALLHAVDTSIIIESSGAPEREEFNRIRAAEGLKAAIAWRNARFL